MEGVIDILVMRHAKSAWNTDAASDFDRPLTARGERDAERMAEWLADVDIVPDAILSSSAVRAKTTVQPIIERLEYWRGADVQWSKRGMEDAARVL